MDAAHDIQTLGIRLVVLTRGANGLVLAMDEITVIAIPPPVPTRSRVGAGDATLAGLLWAFSDNWNPHKMARRAVACGTAAAMQEGNRLGETSRIQRLLPQAEIYT